jgi:hypothetical protein
MTNPEPRVVNIPSGAERPVGSNLAVFAAQLPRPRENSSQR